MADTTMERGLLAVNAKIIRLEVEDPCYDVIEGDITEEDIDKVADAFGEMVDDITLEILSDLLRQAIFNVLGDRIKEVDNED